MQQVTLAQWMDLIKARWPQAQFTKEDGSGATYGDVGDWTAHIGPDMQSDIVGGVNVEDNFAWVNHVDNGEISVWGMDEYEIVK